MVAPHRCFTAVGSGAATGGLALRGPRSLKCRLAVTAARLLLLLGPLSLLPLPLLPPGPCRGVAPAGLLPCTPKYDMFMKLWSLKHSRVHRWQKGRLTKCTSAVCYSSAQGGHPPAARRPLVAAAGPTGVWPIAVLPAHVAADVAQTKIPPSRATPSSAKSGGRRRLSAVRIRMAVPTPHMRHPEHQIRQMRAVVCHCQPAGRQVPSTAQQAALRGCVHCCPPCSHRSSAEPFPFSSRHFTMRG